ncbi:MAG: ASCH domain-containing protein [Armatimonadota bacterium]|nr:ASCH domain-containing protein [Armatimonadota bacterium]MDR7445005.1 ASCH domain-containing protein [Armatimonadota bacterium]MDR7570091.1 ASCH domain-containing protein [Armatimonadota bacterium]MDR7614693.1 ASCH domain-containing protein [Armatimonadota bacterium]
MAEGRLPRRGLVVREPYATWIVEGRKAWELRKHPTRIRGPVGIVSRGFLIGEVSIVGVQGPFTLGELEAYHDLHRGDPDFLRRYAGGGKLWAWVLAEPRRYLRPIPVPLRPGGVLWVDLSGLTDQTEP